MGKINGIFCVNISDPAFHKAARHYGVSEEEFKVAVKAYAESTGYEPEYESASFRAYFDRKYKLSGAYYEGNYDDYHLVWEEHNPKERFKTRAEAEQAYNKLNKFFPGETVLFGNEETGFTVRAAEPVKYKGFTLEMQTILDQAPRSNETENLHQRISSEKSNGLINGEKSVEEVLRILQRRDGKAGKRTDEQIADEIEEAASEGGYWYEDANYNIKEAFGEPIASGGEAVVYANPEEGTVVKVISPNYYSSYEDAIERIFMHNAVFGDSSPLNLVGFGRDPYTNTLQIIVEQPFIKGRRATVEEIGSYMTSLGFTQEGNTWTKGDVVFSDLNPLNVLVTEQGNTVVIDMEAHVDSSRTTSEDSSLLAPNDKVSNLKPLQYALVRTEAFKEWFGDWEKPTKFTALNVDDIDGLKQKYAPVHPNEYYHHSTIRYGKQRFDSREGTKSRLHIIGRLTTDKVDVLVVENPDSANEIAHITLSTAEGVKPVESNTELKNNRDKIVPLDDYVDTTFTNNLDRNVSKVVDENGEPLEVYHGGAPGIVEFNHSHGGEATSGGYYTDEKTGEEIPVDSARTFFFSDSNGVSDSYATLYGLNKLNLFRNKVGSLIKTFYDGKANLSKEYFPNQLEDLYTLLDDIAIFNPRSIKLKEYIQKLQEQHQEMPEESVKAARDLFIEIRKAIIGASNSWEIGHSSWIPHLKKGSAFLKQYNSPEGIKKLLSGEIPAVIKKEWEVYKQIEADREAAGKDKMRNFEKLTLWLTHGPSLFVSDYTLVYDGQNLFLDDTTNINGRMLPVSSLTETQIKDFLDAAALRNKTDAERDESNRSLARTMGKTYPVFLNLRNPLEHDYRGTHMGEGYRQGKHSFGYIAARHVNKAIQEGNDGVIYRNIYDPFFADNYGVFDPNQIKSSTGENIEFGKSENIYHKESDLLFYDRVSSRRPLSLQELDFSKTPSFYKSNPIFKNAIKLAESLGIKYEYKPLEGNTIGEYSAGTVSIGIESTDPEFFPTLYHETIHAVTSHIIHSKPENLSKQQRQAVKILEDVFVLVKARQDSGYYGLESIDEFVAELSNPEFRAYLKSIKIDEESSLWERVLEFFRKIFSADALTVSDKALEEILASQAASSKKTYLNNYSLSSSEKDDIYNQILEALKSENAQAQKGSLKKIKTSTGRIFDVNFSKDLNNTIQNHIDGDGFEVVTEYDSSGRVIASRYKREASSLDFTEGKTEQYGVITDHALKTKEEETPQSAQQQIKELPEEDKAILQEEFGTKEVKQPTEENPEQKKLRESVAAKREYRKMSSEEKTFISREIASYFSHVITGLQNGTGYKQLLDGDWSEQDFTQMSREEIIDTVGVGTLLNLVKDVFFNPVSSKNPRALEIRRNKEMREKFMFITDNWNAFVRAGYPKLMALEGISVSLQKNEYLDREGADESVEENGEMSTIEEKEREYWQIGFRQLSAVSSLSQAVRRKFETLMVRGRDGVSVKDDFGYGLDTFVDSNLAINSTLEWTQNCLSVEEMEQELSKHRTQHPWVDSILEEMKNEPFRSVFYNNFRKDFTDYSVVTVSRDKEGNRVFSTTSVNRMHPVQTFFQKAHALYRVGKMNGILNVKADGSATVNTEGMDRLKSEIKALREEMNDSYSRPSREVIAELEKNAGRFQKVLSAIGIEIDKSTIVDALAHRKVPSDIQEHPAYKMLKDASAILSNLEKRAYDSDRTDHSFDNPFAFAKDNLYVPYQYLLNPFQNYLSDSIEASVFANDKTFYSYNTPSYMGKLVKSIHSENANEFFEKEYGFTSFFKNDFGWRSPWLKQLVADPKVREVFQHKMQLSMDRTDYTELSRLGYAQSILSEYFAYDNSSTANWAWYRVPMMSNKPANEFIRFYRYRGKEGQSAIIRQFQMVLGQEITRIQSVIETTAQPSVQKIANYDITEEDLKQNPDIAQKLADHTLTRDDLVKDGKMMFQKSGARFHFLSFINNEIINDTEFGKLLVDKISGRKVDEADFAEKFAEMVRTNMETIVSEEYENLKAMGMFDTRKDPDRKVKGKTIEGKIRRPNLPFRITEDTQENMEQEIRDKVEEFVWNDMLASINIIQLTTTDLAYYKNTEDFQKRFAQIHSPGLRLNKTATFKDENGNPVRYSDGKMRTIYIKDFKVVSEIIPSVKEVFDARIEAAENPEEKKRLATLRDEILESLKDVNVTDAQGYSSPTSYRKKMGMMGKWDDRMEQAYQRIRKGDFNVDDLNVVWQPLKPFVFTNMNKVRNTSGDSYMANARVPMQNKNSEYMLLFAGALASSNKNSTLGAIYDFMEESAYGKDGYNGRGIDTIQFNSAGKVGLMGVLDLNGKSYEEAKALLEKAAYLDSETRDGYNTNYVHEYDSDDYSIQQEVPAHFQDHEQQMGSQVRVIIPTDFRDSDEIVVRNSLGKNEVLKAGEAKREYYQLLADNIRDSFDKLMKVVDGATPLERRRNLEKILQEQILNDQKYGDEFAQACTLNEDGEFTIPLDDPIISQQVQKLLNSIIKSRINKQKVSGGPIVQVSNYGTEFTNNGLSRNLHIKFAGEGLNKHVEYFECMMPCPSEELERDLTVIENGKTRLLSVEEAIQRGILSKDSPLLEAIGLRIPTEDKYSTAPLKVVGFLPRSSGEGIMLPYEITWLSGSDFDIDKIYIMQKDVFRQERVNWRRLASDLKSNISGTREERLEKARLIDSAVDEIQNGSFRFSEGSYEQVIQDYFEKNRDKYTEVTYNAPSGTDTREGRNNRIFDIQWGYLTSPAVMDKMFNPGNFEVQKKAARIVRVAQLEGNTYTYSELAAMSSDQLDSILESSNTAMDITRLSTQIQFHQQNMVAGKLIGIFANNNTAHAIMQGSGMKLQNLPKNGIVFNGIRITNGEILDPMLDRDGGYVSKTIASFLASSVDAVKDPVLNYMNINTATSGAAMVLARLGFDTDSIALFMSQPIVRELTDRFFRMKNEDKSLTVKKVVGDYLKETGLTDSDIMDSYMNTLNQVKFTKENLITMMNHRNDKRDQATAALFNLLLGIATDLQESTFLTKFNSITNAAGPTIADNLLKRARIRRFEDRVREGTAYLSEEALSALTDNPMTKAFYDYTLGNDGAADRIFQDFFESSPEFAEVVYTADQFVSRLDDKAVHALFNEYVLFRMTETDMLSGSESSRKSFLTGFPDYFIKNIKGKIDNPLVEAIVLKEPTEAVPFPTLTLSTSGMTSDQRDSLSAIWTDMYLSDNPEEKKAAEYLFKYNLYRTGLGYSPTTFLNLASVDLKLGMEGYVKVLRDLTDSKNPNQHSDVRNFVLQFLRNHAVQRKWAHFDSYVESRMTKVGDSYFPNNDSRDLLSYGVIYDSETQDVFIQMPTDGDTPAYFIKTTPLGNANNGLEYDAKTDALNMRSVLESAVGEDDWSEGSSSEGEQLSGKNDGSIEARPAMTEEQARALTARLQAIVGQRAIDEYVETFAGKEVSGNELWSFIVKNAQSISRDPNTSDNLRKEIDDILDELDVCR